MIDLKDFSNMRFATSLRAGSGDFPPKRNCISRYNVARRTARAPNGAAAMTLLIMYSLSLLL